MTARHVTVGLLLAALAATGGWWLWQATEWHETTHDLPLQGEAATNRWYTLQRLAERAGARTVVREQVEPLPPTDATLVLMSIHWDLFPGRSEALRRWVEAGGHLVLSQNLVPDASEDEEDDEADHGNGLAWVGVVSKFDKADSKALVAQEQAQAQRRQQPGPLCRPYLEKRGTAFGAPSRYRVCHHAGSHLAARTPVRWSVDGPAGPALLSVAIGRGVVTVLSPRELLHNRHLLDGDHALLAAAALQLQPGRSIWLVGDETRTPLLAWLWQHGWPAVLLAALVILLWLARRMPRFGPLRAPAPRARRAVSEQVRGTAAFLMAQHGAAALLAAQRRALAEAAQRHIAGFATLDDAAQAAALAARTGLRASQLAAAWQGVGHEHPRWIVATLQLQETARRRLAAGTDTGTAADGTRHQATAAPTASSPTPVTKDPADADQP